MTRTHAKHYETSPQRVSTVAIVGLIACASMLSGCQSLLTPISGVPAHRLPAYFHALPKNNLTPIPISRLRQEKPEHYLLDSEDILGIYIEGVLGNSEEPPPVHFPEGESDRPPALGFPIPIREDGTISLPLIPSLNVKGKTVRQVEEIIRKAYTIDQQILQPGKDRIICTLMREREYTVIVMRSDGGRGDGETDQSSRGDTVKLRAYENDVLHALAATGGLPGLESKNEVKILKGGLLDAQKRDAFVHAFYSKPPKDPCLCFPPLPDDPAVIRIPLRLPPGMTPSFDPRDIILESGDIVLIEDREREVYYTGGLLPGGEHQLPRDFDLDVITAMSRVGSAPLSPNATGGGGNAGGAIGIGSFGGVPPGQLYIIRRTPCDDQITIAVDIAKALNNPKARPLVQPGDILYLAHKPEEELLNFGLGTFFTFGVSNLLRGNGR